MENREDILRKIKNLMAKTVKNGCTESEAAAAAGMVGKLLDKYNIDLAEVGGEDDEGFTLAEYDTKTSRRRPIDFVAGAVAKLYGCKAVVSQRHGGSILYRFFGRPLDGMACVELMGMLDQAIEGAAAAYKKSHIFRQLCMQEVTRLEIDDEYSVGRARQIPRTVLNDYRKGYAMGLNDSLIREEHRRKAERFKEHGSTGASLILIKDQKVEEEFGKQFADLKSAAEMDVNPMSHATRMGMGDGREFEIAKQVGGPDGEKG